MNAQIDTIKKYSAQKDSGRILKEVFLNGFVTSKQLVQQPINVSAIDTRPFYNTNITGIQLLKQIAGIKIKQEGGFGSVVNFFINGSTGKQVKFFIDGLPQDNLGETQSLNILPVEQTERIEVYKGSLPVDLGADALGGAINIITRREIQNYFDASYAFSSFNTHRFNVSGKKYFSKNFFAGIHVGANYTDNNYKIIAEVPNRSGNPETKEVRRFHDGFKNYMVRAEGGWAGTHGGDQFTVTFINSGLNRQLQNNLVMTQPYGQAFYKENLFSSILKYQKNNLFKKMSITAFASYNLVEGLFTDTSKNVYNWKGLVVDRKLGGGEIVSSGNELNIYTDIYNARVTVSYRLKADYKIVFSNTLQRYYRTGEDSIAKRYYSGIDFYSNPSAMTKNVAGIGFEGKINSRLKLTASVKYLFAHLKGYTFEWTSLFPVSQNMQDVAFNAAAAYTLTDNILLKLSCEHALRLPEPEEAFGDLMLVKPNPNIRPEKSNNANLNFLYSSAKLDIEVSGFYRDVSNIIYLRPALTAAVYQNLLKANVKGAEGNVQYLILPSLLLNGNATFQDLRNRSVINGGGIDNGRYKNARLPNIPYLFANGGLAYAKNDFLQKKSTVRFWWSINYTHEYFLYWETDGARELKNRIPAQFLQQAGISYAFNNLGLSFSFEVNNITNQQTYDNFKAQLPGRSCSLKVRFYHFKQL